MLFIIIILIASGSTLMYWYLHVKTRMNVKFLLIDNFIVIVFASLIACITYLNLFHSFGNFLQFFISLFIGGIFILGLGFSLTMIRFWRTPRRNVPQDTSAIVSPADGNIIYIKEIIENHTPIAVKNGVSSKLEELTKTKILQTPCWLIGINMTPFDVHKNCAPVTGKIVLNKHTKGKFLSLKLFDSETQNERNTIVIENENMEIGVVQIASKLVKRIDSYVNEGDHIQKGQWFGMIRFGSQVDLIIPRNCEIMVREGEQVYASSTIIAKYLG